MIARAALLIAIASACGGGSGDQPPQPDPHEQRPRRIIEPPSGIVRPLPPHAIRAEGVGPYKLGERLDQTLEQLSSGPRIALYDIANVVHRSLIRAEDDTVLIGAPEPTGTATFIAVINGEVARTESGIHVGSTRAEISKGTDRLADEPDRAHDPRVVAVAQMPNLRAVLDGTGAEGDRAIALVLVAETPRAVAPDAPVGCARPAGTDKLFGTCTGSGGGELVGVEGDDIAVRAVDGDHPPVAVHLPGLVYAAPVKNPADGRDELVAISRTDDPSQRTWSIAAFRMEGGKLVRTIEPQPLYQLSAANARWIGAELDHVELYLDVASRPDALEISGLLTTKVGTGIRDVVTISPVTVARRRAPGRQTADGSAAAPPDAGVPVQPPVDAQEPTR